MQWVFILSAGLVHTNTQDGFILTRVIIDTSLLYATTLSPLMQPSSYSLYSAPMARDIFCTPSPSPGDARVMFAQTSPKIMHTFHPTHLPSWKMGKKSTRTTSLTTLDLSIIERLGAPMGQDHPGDGLSNGKWDTLIRIRCSCNGDCGGDQVVSGDPTRARG